MLKLQIDNKDPKVFSSQEIQSLLATIDVAPIGNGNYSLISDNKSYLISIITIDMEAKKIDLKINNHFSSIKIYDKMDMILEKLGIDPNKTQKLTTLKAPMPGMVIEWAVKAGDHVMQGDKLLILEAMKMENVIKASGEGKISKILVSTGVAVEKNQLLIEFE